MKLLISSLMFALIFTGCSQTIDKGVPNYTLYKVPTMNTQSSKVENMNEEGTIFKVSTEVKGKVANKSAMLLVISTLQKTVEETKAKGYRYFQIISPSTISNTSGFPINTVADLTTFLVPMADNVPKGYNGLINAIQSHPAIDIPVTHFGTSKFEVVVQVIKEPNYFDIVWDTNKY